MSFMGPISAQLTLAAAIFPSIYKLFASVEDAMSAEAKSGMSMWLRKIRVPEPTLMVSNNIIYAFKIIYGNKQFSIRCLKATFIISLLAIIVSITVLHLWGYFLDTEYMQCQFMGSCKKRDITGVVAKTFFVSFIFLNVPIDFAAAGVTRALISRLPSAPLNFRRGLILLFVDIIIKFLLAFIGIFLGEIIVLADEYTKENLSLIQLFGVSIFESIFSIIYGGFLDDVKGRIFQASFFAMLLCSLWIWMYFFSLLLFGKISRATVVVNWLRWFLDIEKKPIRSVGLVTAAFATAFYGGILLALQLLGRS